MAQSQRKRQAPNHKRLKSRTFESVRGRICWADLLVPGMTIEHAAIIMGTELEEATSQLKQARREQPESERKKDRLGQLEASSYPLDELRAYGLKGVPREEISYDDDESVFPTIKSR